MFQGERSLRLENSCLRRSQGLISLLSPPPLRQVIREPNLRRSRSTRSFPEVGAMFGSYQSTMQPCICKSNCCAANNFTEKASPPPSSQLCNFENFPRSRHLYFLISSHHLSKIVIIRFLCFFSLLRNKLDYEQITT